MKQQLLILFFISFYHLSAKTDDRIDRQVLIQVKTEYSNFTYIQSLFPQADITLSVASFQLWKVEFKDQVPVEYIKKMYRNGSIENYTRNKRLESRSTSPNDTFFNKQTFHLNDFNPGQNATYGINSIGAWDFQKGITTAKGDTIVVAVCDFGFDSTHEDIDYFINYNEIPYDGIDNDGNGAKDDYRGWNVGDDNHILSGIETQHGMGVCGGIAAKGNNKKGVSGVAWNCKLLPLNNISTIETSIKAYEYCIKMKRLYLQSNKKKGAYIVAINYSLGTTGFLPADEPLWCAIYDSLGNVGILSSCAVANTEADVESYKDMPILCNSPYMINVTVYNYTTLGLDGSAYSKKYVHLAAPHKYWTTLMDNKYGIYKSGASFAAPIVSGAIALMYSNFDTKVLDTLEKNPTQVLKKVKDLILKQVDVTPNLTGKLISDGKLNLYKTVSISKTFQDSFYPRASAATYQNTKNDIIVYAYDKKIEVKKTNPLPLFVSIYNLLGQQMLQKEIREPNDSIDVQKFTNGIYILTYQIGNQSFSQKIVLE